MVVYKIRNKINGMVYIGSTKNLKERMVSHWDQAFNTSRNLPLYNDIRKHGKDAFEITTIKTCSDRYDLADQEKYFIEYYNLFWPKGYNKNKIKTMTTSQPLTQLEQEVFDYLNDTPNARESTRATLTGRISYEFGIRYSEALVIVEKWMSNYMIWVDDDIIFKE